MAAYRCNQSGLSGYRWRGNDEHTEENEWSGSTYDRMRAAFSLIFRVSIENEKVTINPVRATRRKQENNARFLSLEEEAAHTSAIRSRNPEYLPVYLLAMHSGMRLSEQLRSQVGYPSGGVLRRESLPFPRLASFHLLAPSEPGQ